MKKIYRCLFVAVLLSVFNSSAFSQSPACANFSGVFISDSLEQNFPEYYICSGSNIYLKSIHTPSTSTLQWKKNGVDISGATTQLLNVTTEGLYSLTLTQGACTATSSGIIVRQYSTGGYHPYQISSNNISQACTGDSIKLSVPKGFGLTYQWKKNNVNITGIPNSSIYKATSTGSYSLSVTQGTCTFNANAVSLNFSNSASPQISTNKTSFCEGLTTILRVSNINSNHNLQWLKDGVAIPNTNKDSLVVNQTGYYSLRTTKGTCTGNSNGMNISVTNLNLPAVNIERALNYGYQYQTCENNVVKLKVTNYTDGSLQWIKDGNQISGATSSEFLVRQTGNYAVRYQGNELCFSQSGIIPVKITSDAYLDFSSNAYTISAGQEAKINYSYNGTLPMVYNINNTGNIYLIGNIYGNPVSGNTFSQYPNATTTYTSTIANSCGVGTFSNPAIINVGNCTPQTTVSNGILNFPFCIGRQVAIGMVATGGGTLSYEWQKEGVPVVGANSNTLNISSFDYSNIGNYRLKVTGTCGTRVSDNIPLSGFYGDVVFAKLDYPAYTNSDILLTAFSGSSFGNASNAYRWTGPNGFSSTEQNPVIPNGTAANSGVYTVTATNAGGCVNYALLTVTVTTAPITLGNLGTTSFCPNGTLSIPFTSTLTAGTLYKTYLSDANGSFRNQTEIGMSMISPMEVTFPQYLSAGTKYRIRIVSTSPSATSTLSGYLSTDGVQLTISVRNLIGREIEVSNTQICNGSAITGIINSNQVGVAYEWKKDGVSQTTNPSLRMIQSGIYLASATKTGCNNVSKTLNIVFFPSSFTATVRLGNEYQCTGTSIILRSQYYSDSATYQWRKDGNILVGQTKDSLIANQTGSYRADVLDKCIVSNIVSFGEKVVFSNIIENTIIAYGAEFSTTLCGTYSNGILLSLSSTNNNNSLSPYSLQWKKNGVDIPNENYLTSFVNDVGVYSMALTQGNCTVISNGITYIRKDTIKLGLKVAFPYSNEICNGMKTLLNISFAFGINISGYKDGELVPNITNYITETGKYSISGSAIGCVVIPSDTIKVTVGDKLKPLIYDYNTIFCNGSSASMSVWTTTVSSNPSYQWFKDGNPIPFQTAQSYSTLQIGNYKVRVTDGSCNGFSDSIIVKNVSQLPKPKIRNSRTNFELLGNNLSLCNNALGVLLIEDYYDYKPIRILYDSLFLKRNGQIILSQKEYSDFKITQPGTYTIIGKQGTCQTESDPVEIKIGEPITANITGSTSIYPGQKAKLNLNFTGGNAWSYQTSDVAMGQTTSSSPTLKNVSPSSTQTYSITSVASNCGVGTVTDNATVTVLPCPTDKTISVNSGNWNTNATWTCGQIPTPTLDAIIDQGHTVNLPNGYQGNAKKLELKGGINQGVGASLRVSN